MTWKSLWTIAIRAAAMSCAFFPMLASAQTLPQGFVYLRDIDDTIAQEMRYCGAHNFVGRPVRGYHANECILTTQAAQSLKQVQTKLRSQNLSLKVYDCYRPTQAVNDFVQWASTPSDLKTKSEFYPELEKKNLFSLGYIATKSGHSRGSTVDLAIIKIGPEPLNDPQPNFIAGQTPLKACHLKDRFADGSLDFGTGYDCFHERSHTNNPKIEKNASENRKLLVSSMLEEGFENYSKEWWHFQLSKEPFLGSFNFPIMPHPKRESASCKLVEPTANNTSSQRSPNDGSELSQINKPGLLSQPLGRESAVGSNMPPAAASVDESPPRQAPSQQDTKMLPIPVEAPPPPARLQNNADPKAGSAPAGSGLLAASVNLEVASALERRKLGGPVDVQKVQEGPIEPPAPIRAGFVVHLNSNQSRQEAEQALIELKQKHSGLLTPYKLRVSRVDLGIKGVWYRVDSAVLPSRQLAESLCAQIRTADRSGLCWTEGRRPILTARRSAPEKAIGVNR